LDDARSGALAPADFAYVRAGFFPRRTRAIQEQLQALGPTRRLVLVDRVERGDDRIFTYDVTFADRTMLYIVGLAPDNRNSVFQIEGK